MRLELIKIEEGLQDGEVLYHKLQTKTEEEKKAIRLEKNSVSVFILAHSSNLFLGNMSVYSIGKYFASHKSNFQTVPDTYPALDVSTACKHSR